MSKTISIPGLKFATSKARFAARENNFDNLNPEIFIREALLQLESDLVLPQLVEFDYSDQVGRWGDVVTVNRLPNLIGTRKNAPCETIVQQDVDSTVFQLELNQFPYISFKICDGEENRPQRDLIETYLTPAVRSFARMLDGIVAAQQMNFWANSGGHLQGMTKDTVEEDLLETLQVMDMNMVPTDGRRGVLSPMAKSPFLRNQLFTNVASSGSNQQLRKGQIGELYGVDFYTAFAQPYVNPSYASAATATVNNGNLGAGSTVISIDAGSETFLVGEWVVIADDDIPHQITASTANTGTAAVAGNITITPGLKRAIADGNVVQKVKAGALVASTGYYGPVTNPKRYGWAKPILIDAVPTGVVPQVGQVVSFGTVVGTKYSIVAIYTVDEDNVALSTGEYRILLDRPLDAAIADDVRVNFGPAGSFNLITGPDALAMAVRPLAKPRTNGVLSSVQSYKGYSMRIVISYNPDKQAHIVTLDTLFGIGVYQEQMGAVLFG